MSPTEEEVIEVYKEINIASYIAYVPTLILWVWVFTRIMRQRDRAKFFALTIICLLMIVSMIASIVVNQLNYTYTYRSIINRGLNHYYLALNLLMACNFI